MHTLWWITYCMWVDAKYLLRWESVLCFVSWSQITVPQRYCTFAETYYVTHAQYFYPTSMHTHTHTATNMKEYANSKNLHCDCCQPSCQPSSFAAPPSHCMSLSSAKPQNVRAIFTIRNEKVLFLETRFYIKHVYINIQAAGWYVHTWGNNWSWQSVKTRHWEGWNGKASTHIYCTLRPHRPQCGREAEWQS